MATEQCSSVERLCYNCRYPYYTPFPSLALLQANVLHQASNRVRDTPSINWLAPALVNCWLVNTLDRS
jgi:hypothetical protein